VQASEQEDLPGTPRGARHAYPAALEPCAAARRQQGVDADAIHEGHAAEVKGEPCPGSSHHAEQLLRQLRAGRDVDPSADPDDERGRGQTSTCRSLLSTGSLGRGTGNGACMAGCVGSWRLAVSSLLMPPTVVITRCHSNLRCC